MIHSPSGLNQEIKMTLKQHVETSYNGNTAAFARDVGTSHTQATRWLQMDCLWIDGQVWKKQSQFKR